MYLSFLPDGDLISATKKVIDTLVKARNKPDSQLFKNAIDPFSGIFDATVQNINLEEWLSQEKSRQIQKSFQNAIGTFHQEIIGSMKGWKNLGNGNLFDVRNEKKKIIAEIKNKHNTTKGNHLVRVYDDLEAALNIKQNYGYKAYLVQIISKNKSSYDKVFSPSDNVTHTRRPTNENIRVISGQLFYDIASGESETIKRLYLTLPKVIEDITGVKQNKIVGEYSAEDIFNKSF